MTRDVVVTDTTGLHANVCECVRCDGGYRPTELERAAARRALALREAEMQRRGRQTASAGRAAERAERHVAEVARTSELIRNLKPVHLTPEQQAELREMRERMFPCKQ